MGWGWGKPLTRSAIMERWWLVGFFSPWQTCMTSFKSRRTSSRRRAPVFTSRSKKRNSGSLMFSTVRFMLLRDCNNTRHTVITIHLTSHYQLITWSLWFFHSSSLWSLFSFRVGVGGLLQKANWLQLLYYLYMCLRMILRLQKLSNTKLYLQRRSCYYHEFVMNRWFPTQV